MKVVYLVRNPGIASRTPEGWHSAVVHPPADGRYTPEQLGIVAEADVLVVGLDPVTEEVMEAAGELKLIQRLGGGYDNVDLAAAARRGVLVCSLPDFNAATVAEHTIMMILALLRRVFESTLLMKAGRWPTDVVIAGGNYDLQGRTLGIVGLGAIGEAVARRAGVFDVEILYTDRRRRSMAEERVLNAKFVSLDEILRTADIVTLHIPYTPEGHHLVGREQLAAMKPTAILINTARGALVDEHALADALRAGTIAGAGLDVFSEEPLDPRHPLRSCANVLLTPHTAGQTREAMERMVAALLDNLGRLAENRELRYQLPA